MASAVALEAAMADMEAARAAFEATASRVGDELERLQERVFAANGKAHGEHLHAATEARKRRRRSGEAAAAAAGQHPGGNLDAAAEAAFEATADTVDQRLQDARRAMARAHACTQEVRAAVDAAKASARDLLSADRLAALKEARNEGCNALVRLMGRVDVDRPAGRTTA